MNTYKWFCTTKDKLHIWVEVQAENEDASARNLYKKMIENGWFPFSHRASLAYVNGKPIMHTRKLLAKDKR